MHPIRLSLVCLIALLTTAPAAHAQRGALRGLDPYVQNALREWEVPGLAVAVVKDDSVIFARGYGVREIGRSEPVDERTLFAIGSATKAFTAAAVGMLVDEGKLRWNDRATRHLPGFQLYDPYVSRELTVRDLLSHRVGLDRGDLLWYASGLSRDSILHQIRYLEPASSFRSRFGYQNIMYLAAGQTVENASGMDWDRFTEERIFAPLGMTASSTSTDSLRGAANVATPHVKLDDTTRVVPYRNIDNIAPAGSINSNVLDMAQWVRLQLGEGEYRGSGSSPPAWSRRCTRRKPSSR